MAEFGLSAAAFAVVLLALAWLLTLVRRLAPTIAERWARAPMLDVLVAAFTWLPWLVGGVTSGWRGTAGALLGQVVALGAWCVTHELGHRQATRGPRIVAFINRRVGRWRNHLALWVTVVVLPAFWLIRFAEIALYPLLVWLLRFPRYRQADWVNVSRHKFEGLVGHDLVWCLYCDWMTGVYALGAEMLRNVESFWCPIRFYDGKKCENCRVDFPDIDGGWVAADGDMRDVERVMQDRYGPGQPAAWFGHPVRLTVDGREPDGGTER